MAPKGIPAVLAVEIQCAGASTDSSGRAAADRDDGDRESHVGEERIAAELLLKLGIQISPRTVRRYMPPRPPRERVGTQAWSTFIRNHARSVLACDFFVAVTATFRLLYVFVVLEVGTRRILHWNVTAHPTAEWTAQQFRMILAGDQPHRFVIHDRDTIYSAGVDATLEAMGLAVLRTPVRTPVANAFCERLVGTIRRECLDFMILLNDRHLCRVLREWSLITIVDGHTPASDREFLILRSIALI
jgi:putative transposase